MWDTYRIKLRSSNISRFLGATTQEELKLLPGGATTKSARFELPVGRASFGHMRRCSSFTMLWHRFTPRALQLAKTDSAQLILYVFHALSVPTLPKGGFRVNRGKFLEGPLQKSISTAHFKFRLQNRTCSSAYLAGKHRRICGFSLEI